MIGPLVAGASLRQRFRAPEMQDFFDLPVGRVVELGTQIEF
mgnify:CR=1 FL=1